jgi:DNA-directed RNA polymerase specialized sigma24 family protein
VRAQGSGPEARAALGDLFQWYEKSVLTLIRYRRHPPDQTPEDLKQEFYAGLVRRGDISRLDQGQGHFRGWLRTAVTRFLINDWDRWRADKVGNTVTDALVSEIVDAENPEHRYLAAFCWDTLLHALERLRAQERDTDRFDALKRFLPGPQVDLEPLGPIAESMGWTRTQLAAEICRLRGRLHEVLLIVVAETLDLDPSSADAEKEIKREMALFYRTLYENPAG